MVFGKLGCVDIVIDFVLFEMFEMMICFKLCSIWWLGMMLEKFVDEFDWMVRVLGLLNVWVLLICNWFDMLFIGIKMLVGVKIFGLDLMGIDVIVM